MGVEAAVANDDGAKITSSSGSGDPIDDKYRLAPRAESANVEKPAFAGLS